MAARGWWHSYTSVMLLGLGWAILWRSWPAFVAALLLLPFFHAKVRREEHWLTEQFAGYADYARRVPRFWPQFGGGPSAPGGRP